MERFDFEDDEPIASEGPRLNILDLVSTLILLATLALGGFLVYVFVNPTTPLNPLYPRLPTPFLFPTATITPLQLEPTWTPTFVNATDTPTLAPTITLQPSPTTFSLVPPTKTPRATATPKAPYNAIVKAIDSTIFHPEAGCAWFGIGGSVVDSNNAPVLYMTLHLSGTVNGERVEKLTVSGTALNYGQSGFEFMLGTVPVASTKLLTLQLLDQNGVPQADDVNIITYNDCKKNLIQVTFIKNK